MGSGPLRFGVFELDESSGELRRNGSQVHLPPQPFQILTLLAQNAGEVVDRNRIRSHVWGDTAVDFDRSLNVAIAQIRSALNDDADSPRFIQTVPRKGYRFLAAVDRGIETLPAHPAAARRLRVPLLIFGGVLLLAGLAAGAYRLLRPSGAAIRIAVLPFEDLSLDAADALQSDGLFDALLTRLGGVQPDRIQVIGRRSVAYLNARGAGGLREIGDRLKVSYVIEGTARRDGGGLRLAVRMVQMPGETVVWSGTFTQDASPRIFEETLVARVSASVLTTLFPGASPRVPEEVCGQDWEAFQTGRLLVYRGGMKNLQRSLAFFQQSGCAPAQAALAETLVRLARIGPGRPNSWDAARGAAETALKSAGNLAGAHLALGNVAFWHDWAWQAARREFGEALRLNPSDPDAHHDLAWVQVALGLRADALESLETAIAIDPLSARTRMDSAWLLLQIGRFDQAAAAARRTLELDPDMTEARACLSRALLYGGDTDAAIEAIRPMISPGVAAEIAGLPAGQAARRLMEPAVQGAKQDPYERAWRLAWLGSRGEALAALEEAFTSRSVMMPLVAVDPGFAALRNEPRFRKIVTDMGL